MRTNVLVLGIAVAAGVLGSSLSFAGNFVRVSPDLDIYYEEAGAGKPIGAHGASHSPGHG
jgi:hypothetical protein